MYARLICLLALFRTIEGKCVVKTFENTQVNICNNNPPLIEDRRCTRVAISDCDSPLEFPWKESEILIIEVLEPLKELGEGAFRNLRNVQRVTVSSIGLENLEPDCFADLGTADFFNGCNNEITQISEGVFTGTTFSAVFLNGNRISEIEEGAFSRMGRLEFLDLQNNRLPGIRKFWFKDTPKLAQLIFNYNSITHIESASFRGLTNLQILLINFNNIQRLETNVFKGLNFTQLELIGNNISRITESHFGRGIISVEQLRIGMNRITNLPESFRKSIHHMTHLTLFPNPFLCSCLSQIEAWAKERKIEIDEVKDAHYNYLGDFPYCIGAERGDPRICDDKDEQNFSAALERFFAVVVYKPVKYRMYTFC